jgi:hypothetical protein
MFTWGKVDGAIRYEIALSEDPTFTIIEWSYNVDQNFYQVEESLRYDTTYYWRVRGVLAEPFQEAGAWKTPSTPWAVGIFKTESEPAPASSSNGQVTAHHTMLEQTHTVWDPNRNGVCLIRKRASSSSSVIRDFTVHRLCWTVTYLN